MSDVVGAVDLETAKKQLRVEYTEDDALITSIYCRGYRAV